MPEAVSIDEEAMKRRFVEYNKEFRIENSRVGTLLIVFLMPFGAILDFFVYPEEFWLFLVLRVLCSAIALAFWKWFKSPLGVRFYRYFGIFLFVLPSFFISVMIYLTEGVNSPYYAGLNLLLVGLSWVAQVYFLESLISVFLTLLMYGLACYFHGAYSADLLINNLYFILLTGVLGVTGTYFLNRMRYREFALRHELDENRMQLEVSNQKLLEMDKAKTNFFANISHELRTPLTLLIGPIDRLRSKGEPLEEADQDELLDIMQQNAMRLMRLINDLLNLVKLDSGSLELKAETIELRSFLEGVCRSVKETARTRDLELSWNIDDTGMPTVNLDRDKVEKILLNLLFNAIKFTSPGGRIELRAFLKDKLICIEVRDTGKGIAESELGRVFDRFWQAESSSNKKYQGVGLGLALVRDLSRLHGGEASVESELGVGTTMRVTLDPSVPVVDTPVTAEAEGEELDSSWLEQLYRRAEFFPSHVRRETMAEEVQLEAASDEQPVSKPRILIADDEPEMMRFLCSQLRQRFAIDEVSDGAEALEVAGSNRYHLILLDFMMPHFDGVEVTRRLREMPQHRSVPIVILTARADEESKFQALNAGATDFLTKPFSSTELLARCRNLSAVHEMQIQLEHRTKDLEEALEQIKQTEVQMVQQAKMASLGQLSAGLLHEVNNPLNFATTSIHLIRKRLTKNPHPDPDLIEKPLTDLHDGIRRVSSIVSSLREFTHPDTTRFEKLYLRAAVETAIRFVQIPRGQVELVFEIDPEISLRGNQNQLVHLFINLLQNSVDSLKEKGAPDARIRIEATEAGDDVSLVFEDNGMGISDENRVKIFDAFFTTKKVGQGVGLGLSICHRIIQQHQGSVRVDSVSGEWCRFTMRFPLYSPALKASI